MTPEEIKSLQRENARLRAVLSTWRVPEGTQECTAYPAWFILDLPCRIRKEHASDPMHLMSHVHGPYPSRKVAEDYLAQHAYRYGKDSLVWCHSLHDCPDYRQFLIAANAISQQQGVVSVTTSETACGADDLLGDGNGSADQPEAIP